MKLKQWYNNHIGAIVVNTLVLFLLMAVLLTLLKSYATWRELSREIPVSQYQEVLAWIEEDYYIRGMVSDAMTDMTISVIEYDAIRRQYIMLKHRDTLEQIVRVARGMS